MNYNLKKGPTQQPHKYGGNGGNASGSSALTAVAFQEHLLTNIGHLSLSDPLGQRRNFGTKPKNYKKDAKAQVDTGLNKPRTQKKEVAEKEFVLDAKPPAPTLAQKLGLVEAPKPLLSEQEWGQLKHQSNERNDSWEPCVICKEDFGTQQQVILSCSHVFHRTCLAAFERFSGRKTCPMCRREQYQTRVIHEGSRMWRQKCATKIQATWRGYVVRSWYKRMRETVPPKDPKMRQKFYEDKLSSITERMVRSLDFDVNGFLSEIDRNLEASRDVFNNFDNLMRTVGDEEWEAIQLKAVERGKTECPICLCQLEREALTSREGTVPSNDDSMPKKHAKKHLSQSKSATSSAKQPTGARVNAAKSDTNNKVPPLSLACKNSSETRSYGKTEAEKVLSQKALLSCSHVFHFTCLQAFEELAVGENRHTCPVCRAHYQKKILG